MQIKKWRSAILSSLKKRVVLRGTLLAGLGIAVLAYSAVAVPFTVLQSWGWLLFLTAGSLIAAGLLPYRRLCRLETQPYELSIDSAAQLHVGRKGADLLAIPLSAIARIGYIAHPRHYGIALWLKEPLPKKGPMGCDLFLPYFSEKTFHSFLEGG